jgi:hypothetical protein
MRREMFALKWPSAAISDDEWSGARLDYVRQLHLPRVAVEELPLAFSGIRYFIADGNLPQSHRLNCLQQYP